MRRMLCILTITAIVLIGTVAAVPVVPEEFYGSVFLNGNPAPVGTVIIAKINGEERGNFTTTEAGLYGSPGNFDPRLFVVATEDEVNAGNASITFFVGGVQAFQAVPFRSGGLESTKLDLFANINAFATSNTTNPISSSAGGSSGGTVYSSGGAVSSSSGTASGTTSGGVTKTTDCNKPRTDGVKVFNLLQY